MIVKELNGVAPQYGENCFFAENATVIGDVVMGDNCSIWYNAVVRGDVHYIRMGNKVNVQDGAVIHGTYQKSPTNIGDNVSIAHNAVVHGCTIEDHSLVGINACIMDGAVIGRGSIVAGGAMVKEGDVFPPGSIIAGVPAKKIAERDSARANRLNAWQYHLNMQAYQRGEHRVWTGDDYRAWLAAKQREIDTDADLEGL